VNKLTPCFVRGSALSVGTIHISHHSWKLCGLVLARDSLRHTGYKEWRRELTVRALSAKIIV
jgi:hypothetical protein